MSTPQDRFNETYITASEVCSIAKVDRASLTNARNAGYLPGAFKVDGIPCYLWERESVMPFLNAWVTVLEVKRNRKG